MNLEQLKKENREKWEDELCCLSPDCEKSRQTIEFYEDLCTTSYHAGVQNAMEILQTFKNEIPKTTREPFELAENVGKQMVLDEIIKALEALTNQ